MAPKVSAVTQKKKTKRIICRTGGGGGSFSRNKQNRTPFQFWVSVISRFLQFGRSEERIGSKKICPRFFLSARNLLQRRTKREGGTGVLKLLNPGKLNECRSQEPAAYLAERLGFMSELNDGCWWTPPPPPPSSPSDSMFAKLKK